MAFTVNVRMMLQQFRGRGVLVQLDGHGCIYKRYNNAHSNAYKTYEPSAMYGGQYHNRWIETTYDG